MLGTYSSSGIFWTIAMLWVLALGFTFEGRSGFAKAVRAKDIKILPVEATCLAVAAVLLTLAFLMAS